MDFLTPEFFATMGFPAVVCLYTLIKLNKTMEALTAAINQLTSDMNNREKEHAQKLEKIEDDVKALKFKMEAINHAGH